MRIGVTGGSGFIGDSFCQYIAEEGHELARFNCDLAEASELSLEFSELAPLDVLVHLAGRFSGSTDVMYRDNLVATHNLLSVVSEHPEVHLIFGSTGAVYGNTGSKPISEIAACNPNTINGLVKYFCERVVDYYTGESNLRTTILRFPSVYGTKNSKGIIFNWLQGALADRQITIHGDGSQQRSFVNVLDVCDAILEIAQEGITGTYNVSHHRSYDLNELSKIFGDIFQSSATYRSAENALESMVLDATFLSNVSSWKARRELEDFLELQRVDA